MAVEGRRGFWPAHIREVGKHTPVKIFRQHRNHIPDGFGIICVVEKYFNTAGPCIPDEHYMLPALDRLPEIRHLIARRQYFVIHAPRQTGKTTPHLVLMAFLQRVTNGKGHIIREMVLGSGRLDLCVEYRDKRYAVEVKTAKNFKGDDSYRQLADYLDKLGLTEGWMPIFDECKSKAWEEKLYTREVEFNGKTLHIVGL